ncbi:MAG: hypothetical protein GY820_41775, partial [Gammaproteobacteria bacterium]|nr:hypothetical protein [Gammaproteobacteria bacterium]
ARSEDDLLPNTYAQCDLSRLGPDRGHAGDIHPPLVRPLTVGPFLFDRYWMDLEFKKNPGVLADPKKMQRFFKVARPKKSNFGPLLLVAGWSDLKNSKKPLDIVQPNRFGTN